MLVTRLGIFFNILHMIHTASSGARISACASMYPGHSYDQNSLPVPYNLVLTSTIYDCGSNIQVTIQSLIPQGFKGFLCQPRHIANEYITYGRLTPRGNVSMTNNCAENSSLTHTEASEKTSATFTWTAPEYNVGTMFIVCTIVKNISTHWMNVMSHPITFSGNCLQSSISTTKSTNSTTSGRESTSFIDPSSTSRPLTESSTSSIMTKTSTNSAASTSYSSLSTNTSPSISNTVNSSESTTFTKVYDSSSLSPDTSSATTTAGSRANRCTIYILFLSSSIYAVVSFSLNM